MLLNNAHINSFIAIKLKKKILSVQPKVALVMLIPQLIFVSYILMLFKHLLLGLPTGFSQKMPTLNDICFPSLYKPSTNRSV